MSDRPPGQAKEPFTLHGVSRPWKLQPTDISQFIHVNQCQRFLRLRLHEQQRGDHEFKSYGVVPQTLPPLLAESGKIFEDRIEAEISAHVSRVVDFSGDHNRTRQPNNAALVALAGELRPGEAMAVFQPRLQIPLGDWLITGLADVIQFERDEAGELSAWIVDIKSSPAAKVEHRLQVAFYHEALERVFQEAGSDISIIQTAILHRAPEPDPAEAADVTERRNAARERFGTTDAALATVEDPEAFRRTLRDLVFSRHSVAEQVAAQPFAEIPFVLSPVCDACTYNQFCMKWVSDHDDLSLLPFLTLPEKQALQRSGISTIEEIAGLKVPGRKANGEPDLSNLLPAPGQEALVKRAGAAWPVGPRLDELIHRSWSYLRSRGDDIAIRSNLPHKGKGSLPYFSPTHNPNLVQVFIEVQYDHLQERVYLAGALVSAVEHGVLAPNRRRVVLEINERPPEAADEEQLLVRWIRRLIEAVVELAAPDANGERKAPIHLVFATKMDQEHLLEALTRHGERVFGGTALYDFVTQQAAYDSPVVSYLDVEIRDLKNIPKVCQSLPIVAEYFGFKWGDFRQKFRERQFDYTRRDDRLADDAGKQGWFTGRARFNGQIPLEYAYGAWNELPAPARGEPDNFRPYRDVNLEDLRQYAGKRLFAIADVAHRFAGNKDTEKTAFVLPDLSMFEDRANTLADALAEFMAIERHVYLAGWKHELLANPERRAAAGTSLIVEYRDEDQTEETRDLNRANVTCWQYRRDCEEDWYRQNPGASGFRLPKEQADQSKWSHANQEIVLRISLEGVDSTLTDIVGVAKTKADDYVVVHPLLTTDIRLPKDERTWNQTTAKKMFYGMRAIVLEPGIQLAAAGESATIRLKMRGPGMPNIPPWLYSGFDFPFEPGVRYTIESDPNAITEQRAAGVVNGLQAGQSNTLFDQLSALRAGTMTHLPADEGVTAGLQRFLAGLEAFHVRGDLPGFEPGKLRYIGGHERDRLLQVQGPPGTGKSFTTGFAVLARIQGAMATGQDGRVLLSCHTHAALDVLLLSVLDAVRTLERLRGQESDLFDRYFDQRLLDMPLYRLDPRQQLPEGLIALPVSNTAGRDLEANRWCVAAGTPNAIFNLASKSTRIARTRGIKPPFGWGAFRWLVLDEASQLNVPIALMAALPLAPNGQCIIVGDHRQMPPIVQHDWDNEKRRTFQDYAVYGSVFDMALAGKAPIERFEESFRLHQDQAAFLHDQIYRHDQIHFHSRKTKTMDEVDAADAFVAAVLEPASTLVVVLHDEKASQTRNPLEIELVAPIAQALLNHGYDLVHDFGIVVPHRAQRAALQDTLEQMAGPEARRAVDTVERFQGGERRIIIYGATESDPAYLLQAGKFLMEPRRLNVALSRAKEKIVVVASRSVFSLFVPDEEMHQNSLLWKNLLYAWCTTPLWAGSVDGHAVEVWGNNPAGALAAGFQGEDVELATASARSG